MEITDEMIGVLYLKKIIEECKEKDIRILLTYLPYPTDDFWKKEANMISDIAEEYDVDYLNFTDIDVVNYDTDFADSDSHMNYSGQVKVSKFLGRYITQNFDIEDKRDNAAIADEWDALSSIYEKDCLDRIKKTDDFFEYLLLCYNMPFKFEMDLRRPDILDNRIYIELLEQLGIDFSRMDISNELIDTQTNAGTVLDTETSDNYDMKIDIFDNGNLFDSVLAYFDLEKDLGSSVAKFIRE